MGHIRTGPLPTTRKWNRVVGLIVGGAEAAQVATATVHAATRGLKRAADDPGVLEAVWLLIRLPLAARSPNFAAGLRACDLLLEDAPGLIDISVGYLAAVDDKMAGGGRTDLGEMAQTSGVETINATISDRARSLWGSGPDEVQRAFADLATVRHFGGFARRFFARFVSKCLSYFLSKALPNHVGDGKRFRTVADQGRFADALRTHCEEAAVRVEDFAGEWFSLHRFQTAGDITRAETKRFLGYAMQKLTTELRDREGDRGT
jgi:hypothetical protein